ncbi:hypothetical protein [Luteolibacter soli]|uniref:DUF2752 domain-containing protein n=1 Tax=Luteolibacter soli TaxID=3135280 RepID=A0ABU9AV74_9BACT
MLPRSLYRWKSFWFGLLIILFLAWAWSDSHRHYTAVTCVGKGILWSGGGRIGFSHILQPAPFELHAARMPLASIYLEGLFTKFKTHTLPHWLLFESSLLLWFLFLAWRTRRHRRIQQRLTDTNQEHPAP